MYVPQKRISIHLSSNHCIPSDPHNPEAATKQILSITPIVQGQKESTQFQIPSHKRSDTADQARPRIQGTTANASGADQSAEYMTDGEQRNIMERKDTQSSSVDQFVDAEEKQQ